MITEKQYKEAIQKLEGIYIDNIYKSHGNDKSYMALDEIFPKNILNELLKRDVLTLYKGISCVCCNDTVLYIRNGEMQLYHEYFAINMKQDKCIKDIMVLESLAQIIDLNLICNKCGHTYTIKNNKQIDVLEKHNVYKINMLKLTESI